MGAHRYTEDRTTETSEEAERLRAVADMYWLLPIKERMVCLDVIERVYKAHVRSTPQVKKGRMGHRLVRSR